MRGGMGERREGEGWEKGERGREGWMTIHTHSN